MALGKKYQADWTSMEGTRYLVEILEKDYTGPIWSIEIGIADDSGHLISYKGEGESRVVPVISSSCEVSMVVENESHEQLITDIANADEDQFFLRIWKWTGSAWTADWRGVIVADMISAEDLSYPQAFTIQAIDGLGRLDKIDYPVDLIDKETTQTLLDYIITALEQTGILELWDDTEPLVSTMVEWYEDTHLSLSQDISVDAVAWSRVKNTAFFTRDEDNVVTKFSCMEVLQQVAGLFLATIKQDAGRFYLSQANGYDENTHPQRDYKKDGLITKPILAAVDRRIFSPPFREGEYIFMPMLNRVNLNYLYKQSTSANKSLLPPQTDYTEPVEFGYIQGGGDEELLFSGTVEMRLDIDDPGYSNGEMHRWSFDMMIQVGVNYLGSTNGIYFWSTDSSTRCRFYTNFFPYFKSYTRYININFITPGVPATGLGRFSFAQVGFEDETGASWVPAANDTYFHKCRDFMVRLKIDDTLDTGVIHFYAINNASGVAVKASSVLDLPDTVLGDGPDTYSAGALQVSDGTTWANSTKDWTVGGVGTGMDINRLKVKEALAGQRAAPKVYTGTVKSSGMTAMSCLVIDGRKFILQGGEFSANSGEWSGEWVEVRLDRDGITPQDDHLNDPYFTDMITRLGVGDSTRQAQEKADLATQKSISAGQDLAALKYDKATGMVSVMISTDGGTTWTAAGTKWEI